MPHTALRDIPVLRRVAASPGRPLAALCAVGAGLAWLTRWAVDDAYIGYVYSRNLAEGRGLVFNPGERVEGYTNFLWTLIHAAPIRFEWDPLLFSHVLGSVCFVATILASHRLAQRVLRDDVLALVAAAAVAANGTLIRFSTSGIETLMQCAFLLGALVMPLDRDGAWTRRIGPWIGASVCAAAALLTRLDSALMLLVWFGAFVAHERHDPASLRRRVAALVLPGAIPLVAWAWWKLDYYGSLLPNTLAAKTGGSRVQMFLVGLIYLAVAAISFGAPLLIGRLRTLRPALREHRLLVPLVTASALWTLYALWVGGDWMEFRFLAAAMPALAIALAVMLDPIRGRSRQIALLVGLLAFSANHLVTSPLSPGVQNPGAMNEGTRLLRITGEELARRFPGDLADPDRPILAVSAAGALPYFSRLKSVDVLGLTDDYVAAHGLYGDFYLPGHQLVAPIDYLVRRRVNLIIALDGAIIPQPDRTNYRLSQLVEYYPIADLRDLPPAATVVEIPLEFGSIHAIYARANPAIDRLVDDGTWREYPILRSPLSAACLQSDLTDLVKLMGTKTCPNLK